MFILLDLLFLKKFQFLTIQTIPLALICLKISARSNGIHSHLLFRLNILYPRSGPDLSGLLQFPSPLAVARATLAVAQNGQAARAGPTLSPKGRGYRWEVNSLRIGRRETTVCSGKAQALLPSLSGGLLFWATKVAPTILLAELSLCRYNSPHPWPWPVPRHGQAQPSPPRGEDTGGR